MRSFIMFIINFKSHDKMPEKRGYSLLIYSKDFNWFAHIIIFFSNIKKKKKNFAKYIKLISFFIQLLHSQCTVCCIERQNEQRGFCNNEIFWYKDRHKIKNIRIEFFNYFISTFIINLTYLLYSSLSGMYWIRENKISEIFNMVIWQYFIYVCHTNYLR